MQENKEISVFDIIHFLSKHLKLFVFSVLICGLVGLGITALQPQFTATSTIYNSAQDTDEPSKHFDLVTWKKAQHKLQYLAQESSSNKQDDGKILTAMSSPAWWSSHVHVTKSLTLDESKELLGINSMIVGPNKPSDESDTLRFLGRAIKESTRISRLTVSATASTAEQALREATFAAKFIEQGLGILECRELIQSMRNSLVQSERQTELSLEQANVELTAKLKRRDALILLQKEFPIEKTSTQVITVTEASTKYLPLANQLIAVTIDINELKERIASFKQQEKQNNLTAGFIAKAAKIIRQEVSFDKVGEQLLDTVVKLQNELGDGRAENMFNFKIISTQIKQMLADRQSQMTLGPTLITKKPDYFKSTIKSSMLGLALGLILALLSLIFRTSLKRQSGES